MYNRYIPQPDGSYRRSRYPEHPPQEISAKPAAEKIPNDPTPQPEPQKAPPKTPPCPQPRPVRPCRNTSGKQEQGDVHSMGIGSFLRQLLPKEFDTGDLIVVFLLLLMSSDCQEEQNTALLTLALYLFL